MGVSKIKTHTRRVFEGLTITELTHILYLESALRIICLIIYLKGIGKSQESVKAQQCVQP